ncbi:sodium- and chloride-dependent glycine transporter 2-like [Pollicipes pollicipes]|uniref:sodium- and chloride-dependent glycine transporter 2-like n=1 Tax=Pollicipes pollicipes TaxID=41117 RepID=UPI001884C6E9|nr:sodium- and chloride-dependent glycine transporter 2-like [Pollicipes pollicipes]
MTDKTNSSQEDDELGKNNFSENAPPVTLPPIQEQGIYEPASLLKMEEKKKRTIETEFGTIIIDSKGITVRSERNLSGSAENQATHPSTESAAVISSLAGYDSKRSSQHHVGSRMILLNTSNTSSRAIDAALERQERTERGVWGSDLELILVMCSSLCGMGKFVFFPRFWLKYGGFAFHVAYMVWLLLLALPLFLLESALGQFTAHGMTALMPQMAPALKGYSYAMLLSLVLSMVAYMPDVSTAVIYGIEATRNRQLWMNCTAFYNSDLCYTRKLDQLCRRKGALLYASKRCLRLEEICGHHVNSSRLSPLATACVRQHNGTALLNMTEVGRLRETAGNEFFNNVPHRVAPVASLRHLNGPSLAALLGCWTFVALVSQAGLGSFKYSLPFLLALPLLIVFIILVNIMVFGDVFHKIWRHLIPDIGKLGDPVCWFRAGRFAIFSMDVGMGINTVMYSRNLLTHDCKRSAITITGLQLAMETLFGLLYTFLLGKQAADLDVETSVLTDDSKDGHPLIVLSTSLGMLSDSQTWSALLFLALVLLGMGTCQAALLTIETSLRELSLLGTLSTRSAVFTLCIIFFVLDTLFTFPSGYYAMLALQQYAISYFHVVLTFALVVCVNAILGVDRVLDDIVNIMSVHMRWSRSFWALSWRYVCPLLLLSLFVASIVYQAAEPLRYMNAPLPAWTSVFGGVMVTCPLVLLIGVVFRVHMDSETYGQDLFVPTRRWRAGLRALSDTAVTPKATDSSLRSAGQSSSHFLVPAAPSLMTQMYSGISSRHLVGTVSSREQKSSEDLGPEGKEADV